MKRRRRRRIDGAEKAVREEDPDWKAESGKRRAFSYLGRRLRSGASARHRQRRSPSGRMWPMAVFGRVTEDNGDGVNACEEETDGVRRGRDFVPSRRNRPLRRSPHGGSLAVRFDNSFLSATATRPINGRRLESIRNSLTRKGFWSLIPRIEDRTGTRYCAGQLSVVHLVSLRKRHGSI